MQRQQSVISEGWLGPLWLALLVAASIVFSLGLACAVPLAAFGAAAALTLARRDALRLVLSVWLANEIVGYAVLGYPWSANSLAWGAVLGGVAVLSTEAARLAARRSSGLGGVAAAGLSFLAAFVAYEGGLFVASVAGLGGIDAYAPGIVGWVFALNAVAMAGLMLLHGLGARAGLVVTAARPLAAVQRGG